MRIRALTSTVLVLAWIVPASAISCPTDEAAGAVHEHSTEAAPQSHTHADHDHGDSHDAVAGVQDTSPDDPSCCKRGPQAPSVQAVLKDAEPRPKLSAAVLPTLLVLSTAPATSATRAQLRRQQPPALPFARTRRPLLI